jgi:hypothetical protein
LIGYCNKNVAGKANCQLRIADFGLRIEESEFARYGMQIASQSGCGFETN